MIKHTTHILLVFVLLLLARCAQVVPLSGGKRDTTPPKLLEAVPAMNSTEFNSALIVLKFNEFVQLKDLSNQLIVSPKLKTTPEIEAMGKNIFISFKKEELQPNTTYRFYIGNAIADMNESNSIQNFEYVFSTGTTLDSLKLKGEITDAFSNKPVDKVMIGLYTTQLDSDSLPYKETPDYIAKSDESGNFSFRNLPYRTYKIVGFTDKNKNSMYDGEAEKVAFMDSAFVLRSDSSIKLKMFQEESPKSFIKKTASPYYGFSQLFLNKKSLVRLRPLNAANTANITEVKPGIIKDTVSFYYKDIKDTLELEVHNLAVNRTDTIKLILPKDNSAKKRLKTVDLNTSKGNLALGETIKLSFTNWMDTTKRDLSKLKFSSKEDSLIGLVPVTGRWLGVTSFELTNILKEGVNYTLKIDTAAFFDVKGFKNDSANSSFKTKSKLEFGTAILKLLFNKKQSYVVQLINASSISVKEQYVSFALSSSNAVTLDFTDVPPDTYSVRIIFDDNGNKKWDTGNVLQKKQPEKVLILSKQLKVLSDWEIEEEIPVKE